MDISDYYLGTPLGRTEYMVISRKNVPEDIQERYASTIEWNRADCAMLQVNKAIYGLPDAGRLAQMRLIPHLAAHGYVQCTRTPCLFRHTVVDDFGVGYKGREHAEHLASVLRLQYPITEDWSGSKYVGMTMAWDRAARSVTVSMPGYVERALTRFGVVKGSHPTNNPLPYIEPSYGHSGPQLSAPIDTSPRLGPADEKRLQQIIGVFLFYARVVDSTMMVAVGRLGSLQAKATTAILPDVAHFLQYAATWPAASVVYHASDMMLAVDSDASYLSESGSRSRAGGRHYLRDSTGTRSDNGAVAIVSTIIDAVMSSACEAEYAALFLNAKMAEDLRATLEDLGWPQGATVITSDNSAAVGIATGTAKQRRSKAVDMRFDWIRDRVAQGHFSVVWAPGVTNRADFFTKLHSAKHTKTTRQLYVTDA
jgi:hypothetical protein